MLFFYLGVSEKKKEAERKTKERETQKQGEKGFGDWPKWTVCSTNVNVALLPGLDDLKVLPDADWGGELEKGTEEGVKWDRQNKNKAGKNDDICFLTDILDQYFWSLIWKLALPWFPWQKAYGILSWVLGFYRK